jgi:molybdate transport system substrate-binding protein
LGRRVWIALLFWSSQLCIASAVAEQSNIAVATNFRMPAQSLVDVFHQSSEHRITVVVGSTGKLFTQIMHGAPFDIFMAADQARPQRLVDTGLGIPSTLATYAIGQLVLIGHQPVTLANLTSGSFRTLAIANSELAPYGLAATQVLDKLGIHDAVLSKLVRGENIGQTYAMVATGNADLGLVARSMLRPGDLENTWRVPAGYHEPIRQDLVALKTGAHNMAAADFLNFLTSVQAQTIIRTFGYETITR